MGCFTFLKIIMFAFNGIIFLAGAGILAVGIWVKVDSGSVISFLGKIENSPPEFNQVLNVGYLLIALGGLLVIVGFLGCCGAIKENKCMLMLFFIIILLVFIAEVAGAVVILVFKPQVIAKFGTEASKNIKKVYGKDSDITGLWNSTMSTLKCCGFNNYTDFVDSPYYIAHNSSFPPQCCLNLNKQCNETKAQTNMVSGCLQTIKDLIDDNTVVIVAVALGIAALEISGMAVSMALYCKLKSSGIH